MGAGMESGPVGRDVTVMAAGRELSGTLTLPDRATGVVLFAHGSGSSRFSPRNRFVAGVLQAAGLGTLLIDLLGDDEANDRRKVFDIEFLAERVGAVALWLER